MNDEDPNPTGERVGEGKTPDWLCGDHIERYKSASKYAGGKIVLGTACGSGYGGDIIKKDGCGMS